MQLIIWFTNNSQILWILNFRTSIPDWNQVLDTQNCIIYLDFKVTHTYIIREGGQLYHLFEKGEQTYVLYHEKPAFCICAADQRHCLLTKILPKFKISSLELASVVVQPGLYLSWSGTLKTKFLMTRLTLQL